MHYKYSTAGLGTRLKSERKAWGLTQTDVGKAAGVTKGAVSAWESGNTKNLRLEHLFAVADKLGLHARWLAINMGPKYSSPRSSNERHISVPVVHVS